MSVQQPALLCQYRYDPLDRLINHTQTHTPTLQRFYCKSRLATEIHGAMGHSIVQHGGQLLAQQQREGDVVDITLLTTDLQRSVLNTLDRSPSKQSIAYTPYGHRFAESGLTSLLGFAGERPDPVTGHYLLGNGYRALNPVLMRFNSPDSLSPFGRGGINTYAYCLGDPINRYDPTGHVSGAIKSMLLKWRDRAYASKLRRQKAVQSLVVTGTMKSDGKVFELKRDIRPLTGAKAMERSELLNRVETKQAQLDSKFSGDLLRLSEEGEQLGGMSRLSTSRAEQLKLLEYIKRRPGDQIKGPYSSRRLNRAVADQFDPAIPSSEYPSVNAADRYWKELFDARVMLGREALKIRDDHFIFNDF